MLDIIDVVILLILVWLKYREHVPRTTLEMAELSLKIVSKYSSTKSERFNIENKMIPSLQQWKDLNRISGYWTTSALFSVLFFGLSPHFFPEWLTFLGSFAILTVIMSLITNFQVYRKLNALDIIRSIQEDALKRRSSIND
jgi:hypothetical protein